MPYSRLGSGQIASTDLTEVISIESGSSAVIFSFILTNTTSTAVSVNVFVNNGVSDRLLKTSEIPSGSGNTVTLYEAVGALSGGDSMKIQAASSVAFNYLVTGQLA